MRIKKILDSVGLVGNVLNQKSSSKKDTYSCDYVNKLNTYSEEEQRIGTYLGKPLYRKVLQFTLTSDDTVVKLPENVKKVIFVKGVVGDDNSHQPIQFHYLDSVISTRFALGKMYVYCNNSNYYNSYAEVTIEYTKTTDEGAL